MSPLQPTIPVPVSVLADKHHEVMGFLWGITERCAAVCGEVCGEDEYGGEALSCAAGRVM